MKISFIVLCSLVSTSYASQGYFDSGPVVEAIQTATEYIDRGGVYGSTSPPPSSGKESPRQYTPPSVPNSYQQYTGQNYRTGGHSSSSQPRYGNYQGEGGYAQTDYYGRQYGYGGDQQNYARQQQHGYGRQAHTMNDYGNYQQAASTRRYDHHHHPSGDSRRRNVDSYGSRGYVHPSQV